MKTQLTILVAGLLAVNSYAALHTETIEYKQGDTACEGYLAYDDAVKGPRPGVLVVHDWMGCDSYAKMRAEMIAKLGYVAFAADIYGKDVRPKDRQEAGAQAGKYKGDRALLRARVNAALDVLEKQPQVDTKRVAAIGYCFGGTTVLELARSGADIAGIVTFHGGLDTPMRDAKNIKCKVLLWHGADDPYVPAPDVSALQDELRSAKVDWQMIYYSGAVHSFTRPDAGSDNSKGAAYNEHADKRSWEAMKEFFAEIFPMTRLAIIDGIRTPFSKAGTDLKSLSAQELGRIVVTELLERTGFDPHKISQVIFGCVAQPPEAVNIARVIALNAGLPQEIPAYTVHRNCASSFEAIASAYEKMLAGQGDAFVVGGTESMSNIPLLFSTAAADKFAVLLRAKSSLKKLGAMLAFRPRDFKPRIGVMLGLTDPVCGLNMGETAEVLYRDYGITREQQDAFALDSHQKVVRARAKLAEEIATVYLPKGQYVDKDNGVRENQTMEALAKLRPVFDKHNGTVTAGNSSQITDGAVALLVMEEEKARKQGFQPLGYLRGYAFAGVDPRRMGIGPAYAIPKALEESGVKWKDIQLLEINEAFAVQVLAVELVMRKEFGMEINRDLLNVNGGAIALGHPVGASGARLVLTLLKEMKRRNLKTGITSACIGGGQGGALILERA